MKAERLHTGTKVWRNALEFGGHGAAIAHGEQQRCRPL
jgi:hypothetical protein